MCGYVEWWLFVIGRGYGEYSMDFMWLGPHGNIRNIMPLVVIVSSLNEPQYAWHLHFMALVDLTGKSRCH